LTCHSCKKDIEPSGLFVSLLFATYHWVCFLSAIDKREELPDNPRLETKHARAAA
jgi:hypothetical protein